MRRSDLKTPVSRSERFRCGEATLPDVVYRDFIDALFSMRLPVLGLGAAFVGVCLLVAHAWQDFVLASLAGCGAVVLILRFTMMTAYRSRAGALSMEHLRRWERGYAVGNYAFALLLAAFNVWAMRYHEALVHLIGVILVFGFCAGVVSRISVRPWICVPSLLIAAIPTAAALILHSSSDHEKALDSQLFAIAGLLMALIAGLSLQSVAYLYRLTVRHAIAENDMTQLAKRDALTGLGNRLLLREHFQNARVRNFADGTHLAVHCLDLDGFKPVNDTFGHPIGDTLLRQVAARLEAAVRNDDMVARLGGDEFVLVQTAIGYTSEAELFARRVIRSLSAPYDINGITVRISASIGIAVMSPGEGNLEQALAHADSALYEAKKAGKGRAWLHNLGAPDAKVA